MKGYTRKGQGMGYQLKTRIAVTVSLLMLVMLLVTSWLTLVYFEREFRTTAVEHLSIIIDTTASDIDMHLQQARQVLQAVDRAVPRSLLQEPQALRSYFSRFEAARLTFDDGLFLLSPDGRLMAVGPGQQDTPDSRAFVQEFLPKVIETRRPVVSEPFRSSRQGGHPSLTLAQPLLDGQGEVAALLAGSINLRGSNLLGRLLDRPVGLTGYLALIGRSGNVVICSNHDLIMAPGSALLPANHLGTIINDDVGTLDKVQVRGAEMLAGFQRLQAVPLSLVGFYPAAEVYEPVRRAYFYVLLALTLLSLASVMMVRRLSGRLTAPLLALAEEVRRQFDPEAPFEPPPAGQFTELGELSDAIQTLMTHLGERRKELKNQLFFLQNLIDTIPSPVFYKDAAFRYLGCNRAFEQYIGLSRAQLVGKTVYDIASAELARVYHQADQELWNNGGPQTFESSVKYADGSMHDVIFYKSIFRDAGGHPAGMIGVFLDISERKQVEEQLQKTLAEAHAAREQVDNILRSAADGLVVTNRRNRVTHINRIAQVLLGVTAEEVIGRSFARLFRNPDLRRQASDFFAIRDVSVRQHDFIRVYDDGAEPGIIQARTTPLRDRNGELAGLVTLLRDVSRERELDRLKNEFISTAAHEMRTPMSVVIGYAELLLDQERFGAFGAEQQQEFLLEITRKAEALSRLVDDLFDISRIEAGLPLTLDRAFCDLNGIVEEVVQRFAASSPRHAFNLSLAALPGARVDGSKLGQVFDNLISNAVKYSPQGGCIEVRSEEDGDLVRFTVADEGIGMTPAQVSRIFDKFYRADSSNTAVGGLGLGMSIVKVIVETHGGRIWVDSRKGQGTRVFFEIPLT